MMLTCGISRYQPEHTIQGQLLPVCGILSSDHTGPTSGGVGLSALFAGFFPLIVRHDTDCCEHLFLAQDVSCAAENCILSG